MNVLVTGNKGYIGSVLTKLLIKKGYDVTGFDTCYYDYDENTSKSKIPQITKDIRNVSESDLKGITSIVHLAALSNEHLCNINPKLAMEINYSATVRLAKLSKKCGIKRFIFISSQNVYGNSSGVVNENSSLSADTPYGKSKMKTEKQLLKLADNNFIVTILRPGAAYGVSPSQRLDIVFNNLIAWGYTTGKIRIMSSGKGYRSIIHIEDLSRAIIAVLKAKELLIQKEIFNVGEKTNYQINKMALIIKRFIPSSNIIYTHEYDNKSVQYKVNSEKIYKVLHKYFHPKRNINYGAKELLRSFKKDKLTYQVFAKDRYIRDLRLKNLLKTKQINKKFYWNI